MRTPSHHRPSQGHTLLLLDNFYFQVFIMKFFELWRIGRKQSPQVVNQYPWRWRGIMHLFDQSSIALKNCSSHQGFTLPHRSHYGRPGQLFPISVVKKAESYYCKTMAVWWNGQNQSPQIPFTQYSHCWPQMCFTPDCSPEHSPPTHYTHTHTLVHKRFQFPKGF